MYIAYIRSIPHGNAIKTRFASCSSALVECGPNIQRKNNFGYSNNTNYVSLFDIILFNCLICIYTSCLEMNTVSMRHTVRMNRALEWEGGSQCLAYELFEP